MAITGISEAIISVRAVDMTTSAMNGMSRKFAAQANQIKSKIARMDTGMARMTQRVEKDNTLITERFANQRAKIVNKSTQLESKAAEIKANAARATAKVTASTTTIAANATAKLNKLETDRRLIQERSLLTSQKAARLEGALKGKLADPALSAARRATLTDRLINVQASARVAKLQVEKRIRDNLDQQEQARATRRSAFINGDRAASDISKRATEQVNTLSRQQNVLLKEQNDLRERSTKSIADNTVKLNNATSSYRKYRAEQLAAAQFAEKQEKFYGFTEGARDLGRATAQVGLGLTAVATMPMLAALQQSVVSAMDFDKSMRNIQAIGKQTDAEIKTLGESFLRLSTDITKTIAAPGDLAEAFYEIQSSGQYGANAVEILTKSTKAATAGLADTKSTAMAVTKTLNAYGMSASEAGRLLDIIIRGVDIGIYRLEDINQQIGDFVNVAGALKVPFEEVTAALTTMTKKGIPAAEAATSLNRIFTTFLKPADAARAAAAEFGITLSAETIRAKGFAGALQEIYDATGGDEDALAAIFRDIRGARGVFALASDGMQMFNADLKILGGAAGSVDQIFNTQMRSWSAQVQNFKNQLNTLAIDVGSKVLPQLTEFMQTDLKIALGNLAGVAPEVMKGFAKTLTDLASALASMSPETLTALGKTLADLAIAGPGLLIAGSALQIIAGALSLIADVATNATVLKVLGMLGGGSAASGAAIATGGIGVTLAGAKIIYDNISATNDYIKAIADLDTTMADATKTGLEYDKIQAAIVDNANAITKTRTMQQSQNVIASGMRGIGLGGVVTDVFGQNTEIIDRETDAMRRNIDALRLQAQGLAHFSSQSGGFVDDMNAVADAEIKIANNAIKAAAGVAIMEDALAAIMSEKKIIGWDEIGGQPTPIYGGYGYEKETREGLFQLKLADLDKAVEASVAQFQLETDATKSLTDAADKLTSSFSSLLDEARNFSKGLGDLTNAPGGGGLAPGANGPFENLYRLQDIAMHWGPGKTPGPDTAKWVEMLSKINPNAANPQWAGNTIRDLQMGNFTPDVQQFIDMDKLVGYAQSLDQASDSQEKLAQQLAARSGVSVSAARTAVGAMAPTGSAAATTAAQSVEVQAANTLLDAIKNAITTRAADLNLAGTNFMNELVKGMADNKQTFIDLFVSMIKDAAKLLVPPTSSDGENSNTNSGANSRSGNSRNSGEVAGFVGIGLSTGLRNTNGFDNLGANSFSQWQNGFVSAARGSNIFRDTIGVLVRAELNTYVPD